MTNWNVVFGHTWTGTKSARSVFTGDELYDGLLSFIKQGLSGISKLPPQHRRIIIRRHNFGYRESDQIPNQIVYVHNGPLPWHISNSSKPIVLTNDDRHVFRVVRPSKRGELIRTFFDDMKDIKLNPHTLFDAIFRNMYIGISRRYVAEYLIENASMHFFRTSKIQGVKPVINSFRPKYPFEHWQIDFTTIGSGTSTETEVKTKNKKYHKLLVIIDIFSKFVYIYPTKDESSTTVATILNRLFLNGDIPKILHSDNGSPFRSDKVKVICEQFHVKQIFGASYSPQTQGFVENKNHYIKKLIYTHFNRYDTIKFYDIIDRVAFTINNTKHSVTGFTPMQIHRGREIPVRVFEHIEISPVTIDDPSNEDMATYVQRETDIRKIRDEHVRGVIDNVAGRRENEQTKQRKSQSFKAGDRVAVATYLMHSDHSRADHIQPIMLYLAYGDDLISLRNPIRIGGRRDAVLSSNPAKFVTDATKEPISKFLKLDYKVHKWYKKVVNRRGKHYGVARFEIREILIRNTNKLYNLQFIHVDPDTHEINKYKVKWLKQKTNNELSEWFHPNMLLHWVEDADRVVEHPDVEQRFPFMPSIPST